MTIDKIKHYLNPVIYEYWVSLHKVLPCHEAKEKMSNAILTMTNELENGTRPNSIQLHAEINLLKHLIQ